MAVGTGNIALTDVTAEIDGTQSSLQDCVDDAAGDFDDTYYTSPADRLTDFKGYADTVADTEAPAKVTGLNSFHVGSTYFTLRWTASTDNVAVTGYYIYQDGTLIHTVGVVTSKYISGLTRGSTNIPFTVKAFDAAGNSSIVSSTLNVTLYREVVELSIDGYSSSSAACADGGASAQSLYHNGTGLYPVLGDNIYTANTGIGTSFDGDGDWWYERNGEHAYEIDKDGKILTATIC